MLEEIKKKKSGRYVAAEVMTDGKLVEMIYDEKARTTGLAIFDGSQVAYLEKMPVKLGHTLMFVPYSPLNPLVEKKVVLFPSSAEEFGTEAELVVKIRDFVHKYLDISDLFEKLVPYYVLLTWVHDRFNEIPYLRALGDFGGGKSRFLQVIGSVCYRPMFAGGSMSVAPMFRIINQFHGTLVLDEADFRFSDKTAEIAKVLNSGFQKGIVVLRVEGDTNRVVKPYEVFGPKIIATRERYNDMALESRFLIEEMGKKTLRGDIPLNLPQSFWDEAREIRNQLLMWRFRNFHRIVLRAENLEGIVEPRLVQVATPLMSIISDAELKKELWQFIREYNNQLVADRGGSWELEILVILLRMYKEGYKRPAMADLTLEYNCLLPVRERTNPRKIGSVIRNKLYLMTCREARGVVVPELENLKRIEALKKKYGLTDEGVTRTELEYYPPVIDDIYK